MSDIVLNTVLQGVAKKRMEELIEEYNNPELTMLGKREVLEQKLFFCLLEGYNLGKKESETTTQ